MDALALEVAVAHHLGAAENLGVELEGAIHVLHGEAEVLHTLQARAERSGIAGGLAQRLHLLRRDAESATSLPHPRIAPGSR